MTKQLNKNDQATNFILKCNGNKDIDTSKINNPYIIYFYPKDDTPGCTIEAIDFSSNIDFFDSNDITIIGVSKDSIEKHEKFISKHNLKILLGADITGEVCNKFGVWVEKSMYGKKYMGIERSTFLINSDNLIYKSWRKVKVKGHVDEVVNLCNEMLNIN